ncbi:hypothetical protein [Vibrio sp. vnigr-6D03]|uniref:hypothetical protein n=1 Tax=Vibrio sp. vnigr-6D03 TaxID=2058088 RepID=UPI0015E132FC|nr:hypothetical protein [Vibrio sp. vnigr-6D03]
MARLFLRLESARDHQILIEEFEPEDTYMGYLKLSDVIRQLQAANRSNPFERWTWRFDY